MRNYKKTPIIIKQQGAPITSDNCAWIYEKGLRIAALFISMTSKYVNIGGISGGSGNDDGPGIMIDANERSLHLDESKNRDEFTFITFPKFKNWSIIATGTGRYDLYICLVKDRK